jgi:iron complex outermembrane recepter protein
MRKLGKLTVCTLSVLAHPAIAQENTSEPADQARGLEEVVVTAQKRAENAQDVPIAISALTASALEQRAIGSVTQIANIVPNVTLDAGTPFSGSTAVLAAYIRGIGADDFAFNLDPGVGIYVDGVYLARTVGANQDLLDVERVEVLKGPQGTLFGRNTIGGAVSIVTRNPGDEFAFTGDVTGGSFDLIRARASVDLPITSALAASVSFSVKSRDGYVKRMPFPDSRAQNSVPYTAFAAAGYDDSDTEGGDDDRVVRAKLRFDNGGAFRVTLSSDYLDSSSSGLPSTLMTTLQTAPGNFAGTTNLPGTAFDPTGLTGFTFAGLYNFCISSTPAQIAARGATGLCAQRGTQYHPELVLPGFGSVNVDGNPNNDLLPYDGRFVTNDIDRSYATGNSFSDLKNWGVAATAELDVGDIGTLKSITAYRDVSWVAGMDADGSPLNVGQLSFPLQQHQFSEELQLIGDALGDSLRYVLGAYYFREGGTLHDFVTFDEGLLQVDGFNTFDTENYAAFVQFDWAVSDLVGVTLGGRYTKEEKEFEGGQMDLNGFNYRLFGCTDSSGNITPNAPFPLVPVITCQQGLGYPDPNNPIRVYPPGVNQKKFSNFSPKLGVQLHPAADVMLYASWSEGYKTGGWTTRYTNPQPDAQGFDEEEASTYEVGLKSRFMRRFQLNAAVFQTEYDGIQLNFQQGTSPTLRNAGDARIRGFELETSTLLTDLLTIDASVGYLDAEYTAVLPGVQVVSGPNALQAGTIVGAELPKTPDWKVNVSPRLQAPLGTGSLLLVADYTYQSESWNNAQRTYLLRRAASDIVNASIGYTSQDEQWSVTLGGTNLTDKRVLTTGNENVAAGLVFGTYNRPREWYLRLGTKF